VSRPTLTLKSVSFSYPLSPAPLFSGLHAAFPRGWTGIVGANGTGKSTLLRLAAAEISPSGGSVERPGSALYCPQRTDEAPQGMHDFLAAEDGEARRLKGQLLILDDWGDRWDTLSHGERKRCQIAVALWKAPEILAIDEPTNHVDAPARRFLLQAMRGYRGVGLLVSHDRELLDGLCTLCLFLEPAPAWGGIAAQPVMRRGGYSAAAAALREENQHARQRYEKARAAERQLEREAAEKKREASQTRVRLSKKGIPRGDQDSKSRIDAARISGKDAVPARKYREASVRLDQAEAETRKLGAGRMRAPELRISSRESRRDALFHVGSCRLALDGADTPNVLPVSPGVSPGQRTLLIPELVMYPSDRVGLVGPNGAGKSTLVRWIAAGLAGLRFLYLPQEIDAELSGQILAAVKALPSQELGHLMTAVERMGTDPDRILRTDQPSPGEVRKVLIARGVTEQPELIVMDEPTNHLDLPSIECLTEALAETACGLFLVSHDMRFLDDVTRARWRIQPETGRGERAFVLET
jgi:macrolide transport system ATP-binding/permease protein